MGSPGNIKSNRTPPSYPDQYEYALWAASPRTPFAYVNEGDNTRQNVTKDRHKLPAPMRLLNTRTAKLSEFQQGSIPQYAILSHTWGPEEVLYADMMNGQAASKKGYRKVRKSCRLAEKRGFSWVWIDTCCIDKSSSAELSEAINSMYSWYGKAALCLVYLEDIDESASSLGVSRWFTRGWTLQELIAPAHVEFYSGDWADVGTKTSLATQLSGITGIPKDVLMGYRHPSGYCVSQRMSWASTRVTTREEDEAYCLLGLFDVNMPLLYGEGRMSFIRLQEQILRQQEDYSIFAWTRLESSTRSRQHEDEDEYKGFLAPTVGCFRRTHNHSYPSLDTEALHTYNSLYKSDDAAEDDVPNADAYAPTTDTDLAGGRLYFAPWRPAPDYIRAEKFEGLSEAQISQQPPEMTGRGIRVTLPVLETIVPDFPLLAWFYCTMFGHLLCIPLQKSSAADGSGIFGRKDPSILLSVKKHFVSQFKLKQLYLCRTDVLRVPTHAMLSTIPSMSSMDYHIHLDSAASRAAVVSRHVWYPSANLLGRVRSRILIGVHCFASLGEGDCMRTCSFRLYCGFGSQRAWCVLREAKGGEEGAKAALARKATDLQMQNADYFKEGVDRVVRRTSQGLVVGAAMRKRFSSAYKYGEFTLEYGVWTIDDCPLWVKHGLD